MLGVEIFGILNQNKMTAVEWLVQQLRNGKEFNDNLIKQAKEMEKEQIVEAYYKGGDDLTKMHFIEPKEYYNETFKSE